jgi:hypothetical protein
MPESSDYIPGYGGQEEVIIVNGELVAYPLTDEEEE